VRIRPVVFAVRLILVPWEAPTTISKPATALTVISPRPARVNVSSVLRLPPERPTPERRPLGGAASCEAVLAGSWTRLRVPLETVPRRTRFWSWQRLSKDRI
jgi:hypothetical protein